VWGALCELARSPKPPHALADYDSEGCIKYFTYSGRDEFKSLSYEAFKKRMARRHDAGN
jgi:hypothetical protein